MMGDQGTGGQTTTERWTIMVEATDGRALGFNTLYDLLQSGGYKIVQTFSHASDPPAVAMRITLDVGPIRGQAVVNRVHAAPVCADCPERGKCRGCGSTW